MSNLWLKWDVEQRFANDFVSISLHVIASESEIRSLFADIRKKKLGEYDPRFVWDFTIGEGSKYLLRINVRLAGPIFK